MKNWSAFSIQAFTSKFIMVIWGTKIWNLTKGFLNRGLIDTGLWKKTGQS